MMPSQSYSLTSHLLNITCSETNAEAEIRKCKDGPVMGIMISFKQRRQVGINTTGNKVNPITNCGDSYEQKADKRK